MRGCRGAFAATAGSYFRKVDAPQALAMGLVNRGVAPENLASTAKEFALALSTDVSPCSVRVMKRQLWEALCQSLGEVITLANAEMVKSLRSEDVQEGVTVPFKTFPETHSRF